jgi:hypothetical protein
MRPYHELVLDKMNFPEVMHNDFRKLLASAPKIKPYDYSALYTVLNDWLINSPFTYSMLDLLMQKQVSIELSKENGLKIKGVKDTMSLKYTSGVCFSINAKANFLMHLAYPWVNAFCANNTKWMGGNGNHVYIIISPTGFKSGTEFIYTNPFLDGVKRFDKYSYVHYDEKNAMVLDFCRGGKLVNLSTNHEYQNFQKFCPEYNLDIEWSAETEFPNNGFTQYAYVHSLSNSFERLAVGIGLEGGADVMEPKWVFRGYNYSFDDYKFIKIVESYDKGAAEKFRIIQNRGWRLLP